MQQRGTRISATSAAPILAIDHGYGDLQTGETLQAVAQPRLFVDPLEAPR